MQNLQSRVTVRVPAGMTCRVHIGFIWPDWKTGSSLCTKYVEVHHSQAKKISNDEL